MKPILKFIKSLSQNTLTVFLFFLFMSYLIPLGLKAAQVEDRYMGEREQIVKSKENKAEEMGRRIEELQKDLTDERKRLSNTNEKIWKDFADSMEVERKELKQNIEKLDEKQAMFESELDRKRQQDEIRLKERELEIKKMMRDLERLQGEIQQDQKSLEEVRTAHRAQQEQALKNVRPQPRGSEVGQTPDEILQNGVVRVATMPGAEIMGQRPLSIRKPQEEYYVEEGDVLGIDFWRAKDLSRKVKVRPDGRISLPLAGDLYVVGLSLTEVRHLITDSYKEYLRDPELTLSIDEFGGRKFIILGQVHSPGVYRYQQSISLLEAIGLAGGFEKDARRGKIMVIRGDIHKTPQVKVIGANVANVLKKGMISENLTVLPNDIIYVGKDWLGDYQDFLEQIITPAMDRAIDFFVLRSAVRISQQKRN